MARVGDDSVRVPGVTAPKPQAPIVAVIFGVIAVGTLFTSLPQVRPDGGFIVTREPIPGAEEVPVMARPSTFADTFTHPAEPIDLGDLVPGLEATLVAVLAVDGGAEKWTWTDGPGGTLMRHTLSPSPLEASSDPSGHRVAALYRSSTGATSLAVGQGSRLAHIMGSVSSFSWHGHDPTAIAWISHAPGRAHATLHRGDVNDSALVSRPVVDLDGFTSVRIVFHDALGFLIEHHRGTTPAAAVVRLAPDGQPIVDVDGAFLAASPDGSFAVVRGDEVIVIGPDGVARTPLVVGGQVSSVSWSPDGTRLAIVTVADDGAELAVNTPAGEVRLVLDLRSVTAHGWSPDGRFLLASGMGAEWHLIAADLRTGTVSSIVVDGRPLTVVATAVS